MTNEEFQKLILDKLSGLEATIEKLPTRKELSSLEAIEKLPTCEELYKVIAEQQKDVLNMLQIIDKKIATIQETQVVQGESINILAMWKLQSETEIAALKKAK